MSLHSFQPALLALIVGLVATATAAAAPPQAEPELTWLRLQIEPLPQRGSATLLLAHDGQTVRRVMVDDLGVAAARVVAAKVAGDRLDCRLEIGHSRLRVNRQMVPKVAERMPLELTLTIRDDQVRGRFSGRWPKDEKSAAAIQVRGEVRGSVDDPQQNAVPSDATWPSYLGPNQNFSSGPVERLLVDDLNDARLAWVSEPIGPPEAGSHRYGACVGVPSAAGGASPLVAHGRVYQFRYQAAGDLFDEAHVEGTLSGDRGAKTHAALNEFGWSRADLEARWRILADEELLCLDAATGRTLWKVRWPGEGLHYFDHKCSLTNWTGVVSGDAVYVLGGTGRLRAVDANTGRERWAISLPKLAKQLETLQARALQQQHLHAPTRSFCHALAAAGDLILAPDSLGDSGIIAIDRRSGEVRWHAEGRLLPKSVAAPLVVTLDDGPTLALAVGDGVVTAIDCRTGETAWMSQEVGRNDFQAVLAGDRLLAQAMSREELEQEAKRFPKERADEWAPQAVRTAPAEDHGQIGCWRVTAGGLQRLWTTPTEWGAAKFTPVGTVLGERFCFRGKFAYQILDLARGRRIARSYLSAPARMDEGHLLASGNLFLPHPDTQHGDTKLYPLPNQADAQVGPLWRPPHPTATTYQVAMSPALVDGRLFIRGADALYCYDLRRSE